MHTVSDGGGSVADRDHLLTFDEQKKLFRRKRGRSEKYEFCTEVIQRNVGGWRLLVQWVLYTNAVWDRLVIGEQFYRLSNHDGLYLLLRDPCNLIDLQRFASLQEDCRNKFTGGEVTVVNYTVATLSSLNNGLAAQFVDAGVQMARQVYMIRVDPYLLFLYRCRVESVNWYEICLVFVAFLCALVILLVVFL